MSKFIRLTKGRTAIVDDTDYKTLSKYKWHALVTKHTSYAKRNSKNREAILMHRQILGPPKGIQVDHINHNGLDNRRSNLRLATHGQNLARKRGIPKSGYKGVDFSQGKWRARIRKNRTQMFLGHFGSAEEAGKAYDLAAMKLHGKFAKTNAEMRGVT